PTSLSDTLLRIKLAAACWRPGAGDAARLVSSGSNAIHAEPARPSPCTEDRLAGPYRAPVGHPAPGTGQWAAGRYDLPRHDRRPGRAYDMVPAGRDEPTRDPHVDLSTGYGADDHRAGE